MTLSFLDYKDLKNLVPAEAAIANRLRNAILERLLAPGTKLPEEHLAEAFSTTRARIRRVLLTLSREHIVDLQPARGAFVARPTPEDAKQILTARRILEVGILEHPCQPLTDESISRLQTIISQERASYSEQNFTQLIHLSGLFHIELARALGNNVIVDMLRELILRTSLIIATFERQKATCCLTSDHEQILGSLRTPHPGEAVRLMMRHLLEIEHNLDFTISPQPTASLITLLSATSPGI